MSVCLLDIVEGDELISWDGKVQETWSRVSRCSLSSRCAISTVYRLPVPLPV